MPQFTYRTFSKESLQSSFEIIVIDLPWRSFFVAQPFPALQKTWPKASRGL